MLKPLEGITVLDFSQFLSGPSAGLRMADLGARVIKVERPDGGDLCRRLYISDLELDGDSTLFHAINRNKESFSVNMKDENERPMLERLIAKADVLVQNFRPGVADKLGLSYESVKKINPSIVYGSITGYGSDGPWARKPGQDLLVQSLSGAAWLNGTADMLNHPMSKGKDGSTDGDETRDSPNTAKSAHPLPLGLSLIDMMAGVHMLEGILGCLVRRGVSGLGGHVEVNMMETAVDMFNCRWTDYLNAPDEPASTEADTAGAGETCFPYGIHAAGDGYVAVASGNPSALLALLGIDPQALPAAADLDGSSPGGISGRAAQRAAIGRAVRERLAEQSADYWISAMESAGACSGKVMDWNALLSEPGFRQLGMIQQVARSNGASMATLRCPIRIDGERLLSSIGSPTIGEHNERILQELKGSDK